MKTYRNFKFLMILSITFLILSACGSDGNDTSSGEDSEEKVTLTAIMEQVPDADIVQEMLSDFEEENPNIKLDIETLPFDQMREKIISSSLAPEPVYDLIIVDNPWMYDLASEGHLEPLNDFIDNSGDAYDYEDFAEPLRNIAEIEKDIFAIPFYNYALGFVYREDLFEEEGLEVPESNDDIQKIAEKLSSDDISGIAMQPERGYKIFEEWANWLFAEGGEIVDESGKIALDSPEARNALTKYIETFEASAPTDSINWGFDEAMRSVSSGKSATMLSYNWMLPTVNDPEGPAGDLAGDFALAEVPGGNPVLGAWYWAIPSNTENKDSAWEFIHWITDYDQDLERVLLGGGPTRLSVIEEASKNDDGFGESYYNTVSKLIENGKPLANGPNSEEMIQAVGTELSEAISGSKSVDQAITDAATQAKNIAGE